nr:reverse transcriptase domain-containing protein [Tanacetum cinerariifolium]
MPPKHHILLWPILGVLQIATVLRTLAQHGEAIRGIHGYLQGVPISKEMNSLRFRMGMVEKENASLCGSIKTMEVIDTITCRQEKRARMELKRQIMPTTRQGANVSLTLEAVQAMINQTLLTNNTTDNGSQNSGRGHTRPLQPARVCSYTDFMKYQPLNFKRTEGVVGLSQWVEKMESVFHISGCAVENQVKGNNVGGYTQRFQELTLMCTKFNSNETEKVDKYISGLPDNIHGNVMAARPKTIDDAIELANDLMDQKLRTYAERQAENKRKLDNNHQAQQ